jgi:hypothetical protein
MTTYYEKNKEEIKRKRREHYAKNKEQIQAQQAGWYLKAGFESRSAWNKHYRHELKKKIFAHLGNKCAHCGFSDPRVLQIDHVNGGGTKEINSMSRNRTHYYRMVLTSVENNEGKYQLLCANCNWIKIHVNDENCLGDY